MEDLLFRSLAERLSKKKNKHYGVKQDPNGLVIKDVDLGKRIVTGFYNTFNFIDSDMDVLRPGATKKSINEHGPNSESPRKIKHAMNHDLKFLPGNIQVLEEKDMNFNGINIQGVYFETKMVNTTLGNDTLINYQENVYDNHSIGFRYVNLSLIEKESDPDEWDKLLSTVINREIADEAGFFFDVKEIELFEGSTVAIGANELTPYLGVKSNNKEAVMLKLFERMDRLEKQLKRGSQSDETMRKFELESLQIKQMITELMNIEPSKKEELNRAKPKNDTQEGKTPSVHSEDSGNKSRLKLLLN